MKQILLLLITVSALYSCGNSDQSKAVNDEKKTLSVLKEMEPGGMAATETGWKMTAKLNGKAWEASYLLPPDATGKIIGKYNDESISLPYGRSYMIAGKKIIFGENSAVDLFTSDEVAIWAGKKGEMEITKTDGNWVEGKFFFTATTSSTDKTIEVTDGFFRISMANK